MIQNLRKERQDEVRTYFCNKEFRSAQLFLSSLSAVNPKSGVHAIIIFFFFLLFFNGSKNVIYLTQWIQASYICMCVESTYACVYLHDPVCNTLRNGRVSQLNAFVFSVKNIWTTQILVRSGRGWQCALQFVVNKCPYVVPNTARYLLMFSWHSTCSIEPRLLEMNFHLCKFIRIQKTE